LVAKARGLADLLRPELPFAAGVCVVTGELLALGHLPTVSNAIFGFLIGFLISGSAMVLNDYFDVGVDRVNHPERPLPSGRVKPAEAVIFAGALSASGLATTLLWNLQVFVLAAVVLAVSVFYNWRYKEAGLLGNFMVAFSVAMTFVLGGVAVSGFASGLVLVFGAAAFTFDLSEEISAGAMDAAGDEGRSVRSLARLKGKAYALKVSVALLFIFIVLSFIPVITSWLGTVYLVLVSVTDFAVAVLALLLMRSSTIDEGRKRIRQLYLGLTLFVIAIIASQFLPIPIP
jgi:geranylgeranylglycerol-phosphate geranylgeranyltransferase